MTTSNPDRGAPPRRLDGRRGGFTLVELLMVVSIVGLLASIAIPNYRNVVFRARATTIIADLDALRLATLQYNADKNAWPADASPGTVPPELVGFLPDGFSFQGDGYELDFDNAVVPGGLPYDPNVTQIISAAVTVPDDRLSNALLEQIGGLVYASVPSPTNRHSIVIDAS